MELEILYEPRPDYGRIRPKIKDRGPLGFRCEAQGAALALRSELPLRLATDGHSVHGCALIASGERRYLSFTCSTEAPGLIPLLGEAAGEKIDRSIHWWKNWAARCTYEGPYRDAVVQSALLLKLMAYAPSGAVIAAPTTSLPEWIDGERNWDYRYCWLRDASFTLRALFALNHSEEALAFLNWLLHATRLTWPQLQVLYNVFGETKLPESELSHLEGYAGSRPVRIGNDARDQLQLDVYGEVLDVVARFADRVGGFDRDARNMLNGLGETVCDRWREPDEGIWEGRAGRQHHTHSKVLCWVALDRLIQMHEAGMIDIAVERFRREHDAIRREVEDRGYNEQLQSYTRIFDGDTVDAALLTIPLYGYRACTDARMRTTFARIQEKLARGPLFYRYLDTDDGLPPGEGAFGICSFWAVECLARSGELDQAISMFEEMLGYGNDVGLFSEEIDPDTGAALGNFPQTFTHVGLINAALTLAECGQGQLARSDGRAFADLEKEDQPI